MKESSLLRNLSKSFCTFTVHIRFASVIKSKRYYSVSLASKLEPGLPCHFVRLPYKMHLYCPPMSFCTVNVRFALALAIVSFVPLYECRLCIQNRSVRIVHQMVYLLSTRYLYTVEVKAPSLGRIDSLNTIVLLILF